MSDIHYNLLFKILGEDKVQATVNKIRGGVDRTGQALDKAAVSGKKLEGLNPAPLAKKLEDCTSAARKLNGEMGKLRDEQGRFVAGSNNSFGPGFLGKGLAMLGGVTAAVAFFKSSISSAMDFEATSKSLEVLTGSMDKGRKLAADLNQLQQNTILGPEVFKAAQTMMGFGVETEKVITYQKQLGDIAMGNAEKFGSLALAFSQTTAAGKLTGQDLLQYINAGFNPLQVMSERWKEFGFTGAQSVGQLKELVEKGAISAAMVAKAMELATGEGGKFNNMMQKMGETTYGKLQVLEGQWENFKVSIGGALDSVTGKAIGFASSLLDLVNPQKTVSQQVEEQTQKIYGLQLKLTSANTTHAERLQLLKQLEQESPNIIKGINAEAIEYDKLAGNIQSVIAALNNKRIAQELSDENSNVIDGYSSASNSMKTYYAGIAATMSKVSLMYPQLAARTDMTFGQKQLEAQRLLKQAIESGKADGSYTVSSDYNSGGWTASTKEGTLLGELQRGIEGFNKSQEKVNAITPKYNELQSSIKNATDNYNKIFGLDNNQTSSNTITPPTQPGTDKGGKGGKGGGGTGGGNITGKTNQAIATGGTKSTNITITIGSQVSGGVTITASSAEEGIGKLRDLLVDEMTRAVAMGAALGGSN